MLESNNDPGSVITAGTRSTPKQIALILFNQQRSYANLYALLHPQVAHLQVNDGAELAKVFVHLGYIVHVVRDLSYLQRCVLCVNVVPPWTWVANTIKK